MENQAKRRSIKATLSIVFIFLISVIGTSSLAQTVLFQDDFSSLVDHWQLEDGWKIVSDNGNAVLRSTQHAFAVTGSTFWTNYSLTTRVKLMTTESATHINFRLKGCERYFIGFNTRETHLSKTYPCDTHTLLSNAPTIHDINRWYTVKIVGNAGNIKVYVDDLLQIDFTDPNPLLSGEIAFEGLDNSTVYFDDVVVVSDEPLSASPWQKTGGPLGGLGYDVRIHPIDKSIMYVTDNYAGVARSNNSGQTWEQTNTGITVKGGPTGDTVNIFSLTVDPNNPTIIWAGTNGEGTSFGIFKSTDGGKTWTAKNTGIALNGEIGMVFRGFTVEKGNSDVVYAQAEISTTVQGLEFNRVKGRVYKTVDGGKNWGLIWQGDNLARYLIIDPNNTNILYLSTGIFDREAFNSDCANGRSGGVGVLKSINGGQSWVTMNNGLDDLYVGSLRMHPTKPNILFAATGNNACSGGYSGHFISGLFKTINGGDSWTKVISNDIFTTVNFSPSSPDIIYAGGSNAFYRSGNGGVTWSRFSQYGANVQGWGPTGIRAGIPVDVTIDGDNPLTLYANNYGGGVFRSLDGAETWQAWSKGYSGAQIHIVHTPKTAPEKIYAIGRSGPYVSRNYGEDWTGIANGDATYAEWHSIATQPNNTETILVSDEHQGVILYSNDGGNNFREVLRHPDANAAIPSKRQGFRGLTFAPSNPNVVYAGSSWGGNAFLSAAPVGTVIYKSVNGGLSFSPLPSVLDGSNVRRLLVDPANENLIYAATTKGVYKSVDGAASWTMAGNLGTKVIDALAIDPLQPGYIIAGELFGGIWISTDGGANWTGPHNSGFNSSNPYITGLVVDPVSPNTIFASDLYSGVYRSKDKGLNWTPFPDWKMSGLSVRAVTDLAINTEMIYAATQGGGVFKFDRRDSDGDGLLDTAESFYRTNPLVADTDGDKILDGAEINTYKTDPLKMDTDGDGAQDGFEIKAGTNPNDPSSTPIMPLEAGTLNVTNIWKSVTYAGGKRYINPVVVAKPASKNEAASVIIQIRNVTATGFQIRLKETNTLTAVGGVHAAENIGYMVTEMGSFNLNGVRVTAGKFSAKQLIANKFQPVKFPVATVKVPVIIASVTTSREVNVPVNVRLAAITQTGFSYMLQEEAISDQVHGAEDISYISWEPGLRTIRGYAVEVGRKVAAVGDNPYTFTFSQAKSGIPVMLADMQTAVDRDPASLRYSALSTTGATVYVSEDTSKDIDVSHANETLGYIVFSGKL